MLLGAVPAPPGARPVRIGADLEVERVEFGYVDPNTQQIVPTRRVDTARTPGFAWRVKLRGAQRTVRYREEFVLPAPAAVWQVGSHTTVAADRASAVTEADVKLDRTMEVRNGWIHSPGDPKGPHVMRVWLDGVLVEEIHFTLF